MQFVRKISVVVLVTLLLVGGLGSSVAQGSDTTTDFNQPRRSSLIDLTRGVSFEIAPHTGMMGKSGIFGLKVSMNYGSFNLELAGEQVMGKTADLYPISVNAVLNLATRGRLIPYGAVGVGIFMTIPKNTVGDQTVTTLGLNFGGGARYYVTSVFGFRLEAKQYITSVSGDRTLKDELLFFQEVSFGLTFMLR